MCGVWETMIQCSRHSGGDDSSQVITEVMLVVAQGRNRSETAGCEWASL